MKWMDQSGCVFWFGCSDDTTKENKYGGTGYTWTGLRNKRYGSLNMFPFMRVWWKKGKVDEARGGDGWIGYGGGIKSWRKYLIKQLNKVLLPYQKQKEEEEVEVPDEEDIPTEPQGEEE